MYGNFGVVLRYSSNILSTITDKWGYLINWQLSVLSNEK